MTRDIRSFDQKSERLEATDLGGCLRIALLGLKGVDSVSKGRKLHYLNLFQVNRFLFKLLFQGGDF